MRKTVFLIAACALMALCGCIPLSLAPFYTEKDLVYEPALIGFWVSGDDGGGSVSFEQSGANGYLMIMKDSTGEVSFDVRLFRIGGKLFMDLCPQSLAELNRLAEMDAIPGHSLVRVDRIEPTLVTSDLEDDWMKAKMKEDPKALAHVVTDDRLVLTATTEENQAFIVKHMNDEGAFDDPEEMRRTDKR
ncbi:MAG: hypothetical protein GYA46_06660 [candidate division Zixibacteria bacterium]|nr:hypothetical protein [candidate division Zixibacteria bacterium]